MGWTGGWVGGWYLVLVVLLHFALLRLYYLESSDNDLKVSRHILGGRIPPHQVEGGK